MTTTAMDFASLTQAQATQLLTSIPGIGPVSYWRLHKLVEDIRDAFGLPYAVLNSVLSERQAQDLTILAKEGTRSVHWQRLLEHMETLERLQSQVITHAHPDYPPLLAEIESAPPILYCRGNISCLAKPQLALVGSRHSSRSGAANARAFAMHLSQAGFVITSGLALGIDAAAHQGCIDVQGETLAVMGTGMDWIYPRRHEQLANDILACGGALLTEFPPGVVPQPGNFPRRNRLISGLSLGVVVIEAALKSGSLITARYALEQNREVFALPGSIHNPSSKGCNTLIREGATLVEATSDILEQLSAWLPPGTAENNSFAQRHLTPPNLKDNELAIYALLDFEPIQLEVLIQQSPLTVAEILTVLTALELKGYIEQDGLGYLKVGQAVVEDDNKFG